MNAFGPDGKTPSPMLSELVWSVARSVAATEPDAKSTPLETLYESGVQRVLTVVKRYGRAGRTVPFRAFASIARRGMVLEAAGVTACDKAEALAAGVSAELEQRWSTHLDSFDLVTGLMEVTDVYLTALLLQRVAHAYRKRDVPNTEEGQAAWKDAADVTLGALRTLPPIQRQLLWGLYFLDEDLRTVAHRLRIPREEAQKQHRWALERLRKPISDLQVARAR